MQHADETYGFLERPRSRKNIPIEEEIEKTDKELNDEWVKWIDERTKSFSIEPVIINRFARDPRPPKRFVYFAHDWLEWKKYGEPDVYVYSTPYGMLEFDEKIVENYIARPVDVIIRARARREPMLGPVRKKNGRYEQTILINPRTSPVNDIPNHDKSIFPFEYKCYFKKLCEDIYETYDESKVEISFLLPVPGESTGFRNTHFQKLISFDRHTDELCLKMYTGIESKDGYYASSRCKKAGRLKFNFSIDKSRQQEIIDFVCAGCSSVNRYTTCCQKCFSADAKATPKKDHLIRQLNDSLKLFCGYQKLTKNFYKVNEIEIPEDSILFFNRKLTNLAISFMKKIRQALINICIFLDIPFGRTVDKLIHQVWFQILKYLLSQVLTKEKSLF